MKNVIIDGVEYAPVKPVQVKDWEIVSIAPLQNNELVAVRRLSDGEIFTVGDEIENINNSDYRGMIRDFTIMSYGLRVRYKMGNQNDILDLLRDVKKCVKKRHVLTTFDGQKIYEGDECWWVNPESWVISNIINIYFGSVSRYGPYFSTFQAAKDYIVENRPGTLSLKDVIDAVHSFLSPLYDVLDHAKAKDHELVVKLGKKIRKNLNL